MYRLQQRCTNYSAFVSHLTRVKLMPVFARAEGWLSRTGERMEPWRVSATSGCFDHPVAGMSPAPLPPTQCTWIWKGLRYAVLPVTNWLSCFLTARSRWRWWWGRQPPREVIVDTAALKPHPVPTRVAGHRAQHLQAIFLHHLHPSHSQPAGSPACTERRWDFVCPAVFFIWIFLNWQSANYLKGL